MNSLTSWIQLGEQYASHEIPRAQLRDELVRDGVSRLNRQRALRGYDQQVARASMPAAR